MKQDKFDLAEFRNHLTELEKELKTGVSKDPDYHGEIDEVLQSLKRLEKELQDKKYEQVLPDLFVVLDFISMIESNFEDEEEDDFEDEDEDDFEDEEEDDR